MPDDLIALTAPPFAEAVDQLEKLLSQSKRAFLLGAGCSYCAGLPLMGDMTRAVLDSPEVKDETKALLNALVTQFAGASEDVPLTVEKRKAIPRKIIRRSVGFRQAPFQEQDGPML